MKHGRQVNTPHRGRGATPWKFRLPGGRLIRRGRLYDVRLVKDGVVLWEGEVRG